MIKTPLSIALGGAFWTPGATILGSSSKNLTQLIKSLFSVGGQGFAYDPNDLTQEKINWRKNQLLYTDDLTYGASGNYTAVKEADGWALTAIAQTGAGYYLSGVQYPIGAASDSRGAGTVVRSIEVKKGAGVLRLGAASNNTAIFVNVATMAAIDPPTGLPYTITAIDADWYRIETFSYFTSFSSSALSNLIGWSTTKATSSTLDTTTQVGAVIRVRNPSFAFVPYESTAPVPYQAITDFNSDFIRQFPLHALYQDAAGTIPVTAAGQIVGLMLDKSKGLNFLPYIVDQKNFTDLSGWVVGASVSAKVVAGEVELTCGGTIGATAANWFRPVLSGVARYSVWEISFDATHVSGGYLEAGAGYQPGVPINPADNGGTKKHYTVLVTQHPANPQNTCVFGGESGAVWRLSNIKCRQLAGNHAGQITSAARPILRDAPRQIDFDTVDDKLITNLPAQLTGCTVIRSVPNVGTQILTGQTIPAIYEDNKDHCGLIVINRALTASETSQITKLFNKAAGV